MEKYDAVVLAVAHNEFKELGKVLTNNQYTNTPITDNQVIFDIKGVLDPSIVDGRL
jgi:UDP-N-acetyl-D-galactosamine dehydrogenase